MSVVVVGVVGVVGEARGIALATVLPLLCPADDDVVAAVLVAVVALGEVLALTLACAGADSVVVAAVTVVPAPDPVAVGVTVVVDETGFAGGVV
jgi:hypothetical protein